MKMTKEQDDLFRQLYPKGYTAKELRLKKLKLPPLDDRWGAYGQWMYATRHRLGIPARGYRMRSPYWRHALGRRREEKRQARRRRIGKIMSNLEQKIEQYQEELSSLA